MIRKTGNNIILPVLFSILVLQACSNDKIFTAASVMPEEVWSVENAAQFTPVISDTTSVCDISFSIRTGSSYPYRNIWLFISTTSPSGKMITDTLQYMLADEKGKWFGSGFGDLNELRLPFRTGIFFPEKGAYNFSVRHGMRTENLRGVYDFGLVIEKTEQ